MEAISDRARDGHVWRVRDVVARHAQAEARLRRVRAEKDAVIGEAYRSGLPVRDIGGAAGLTRDGVYKAIARAKRADEEGC